MQFPDFETWRQVIVHPDELKNMGTHEKYVYYLEKYQLALRSKSEVPVVGEIGVRYGYSAASFCYAHPLSLYYGWDLVNGGHGGIKGGVDTFPHVQEKLERLFPNVTVKLIHADSQRMSTLGETFDIFHVDGSHTTAGCLHDMGLAFDSLRFGGILIVDDYAYIEGVRVAVDSFVDRRKTEIASFEKITTGLRGNAVIVRGK